MKLKLFDFIDNTVRLFESNKKDYEYVTAKLERFFLDILKKDNDCIVAVHSRIKQPQSLKEKLIRKNYYLEYADAEDALDHMPDLIGITVQCRFIRNEAELYKSLFRHFRFSNNEWSVCSEDSNVFLNLKMAQPQLQRNGFTIYRIDGCYFLDGKKINYELQIKSLVHTFWSEIEHEVVYKNPDFIVYDHFNKNMLGAIRDNLDVVDRQLEIMYDEISYESSQSKIGIDEKGFKVFLAGTVNELVNRKMKQSVGFTSDFKKCSAMIAQYVYVRDFVNGEHNREKMIDYMLVLNYLLSSEIDLSEEIILSGPVESSDPFVSILGSYFARNLNHNFLWHVFFAVLFSIHSGDSMEDLIDFVEVLKMLLIQPGWFSRIFSRYGEEKAALLRRGLEEALAEALCAADKIEIVHEDKLLRCMEAFREYADRIVERYPDEIDEEQISLVSYEMFRVILRIFL